MNHCKGLCLLRTWTTRIEMLHALLPQEDPELARAGHACHVWCALPPLVLVCHTTQATRLHHRGHAEHYAFLVPAWGCLCWACNWRSCSRCTRRWGRCPCSPSCSIGPSSSLAHGLGIGRAEIERMGNPMILLGHLCHCKDFSLVFHWRVSNACCHNGWPLSNTFFNTLLCIS